MINFRNTMFIKSAPSYKEAPEDSLKEVLIVGRSNVGKSSLINALCDHKGLAFTSSKPGYTKLLNYFSVNKEFYLVDAPGYGYSKSNGKEIDFFADLMEDYFTYSTKLSGVIFLLDSRRETNEDDETTFEYLSCQNVPFILTLTKADKLNQKEKHKILVHLNEKFGIPKENVIFTSSLSKKGIDSLKGKIEALVK